MFSYSITVLQYYRTKNPLPVLAIPGSFMEFPGSLHPLGGRKQNWGGDGRGRVMGGVIELVIEWRGGMGVV